jgi:hypothetical protein
MGEEEGRVKVERGGGRQAGGSKILLPGRPVDDDTASRVVE